MEAVIAKLVKDFETGAISRRQLIRTLAMVAVGAPLAGAAVASAQPAPLAPILRAAPWKTIWLDHISFTCSDYKKTSEFYSGLLGWSVKPGSDNGRQVTCEIGDIGTVLFRNGKASSTGGAAQGNTPVSAVIDHISFGVEPWDKVAVKKELTDRGLNPRDDFAGGPASGFESYHVKDPDGWDLQISNQTRDKHL